MGLKTSRRTLLIIPDSLPDPSHEDWTDLAARSFADVVEAVRGRTLGHFASEQSVDLAWRYARHSRLTVLREGEASPEELLEHFHRDTSSVLMGTDSLWAQLALPGDACACLVLDRLPFPRPDDPVVQTLRAQDAHWFLHYGLPRAVSAFQRAIGFLRRGSTHPVVIVVLDPRLLTRPYGGLFLEALPGVPIRRSLRDLRPFLDTGESIELPPDVPRPRLHLLGNREATTGQTTLGPRLAPASVPAAPLGPLPITQRRRPRSMRAPKGR